MNLSASTKYRETCITKNHCDNVQAKLLVDFEQFHLANFNYKDWIDPQYSFTALSQKCHTPGLSPNIDNIKKSPTKQIDPE